MSSPRILDAVASPADLKVLSNEELAILADEIRAVIIETTSRTGGHVASSLGAVEIILAIHSLINAPTDRLIFDVGHQSYAHKLVTGRRDAFETLRTLGGISGFPRPDESPYDVHPSGHASDSLSVAAGLARAKRANGTDEKIVTLIGDAALSGGMAFEALNYIGQEELPMVIVLNDNEMSIARNVGALMRHLGNLRASAPYRTYRETMQARLERSGNFASRLLDFGRNAKDSLKQFFIPQEMIFENLGIVCTAPVDGHDIALLREVLTVALEMDGPIMIHAVTRKGAGYGPAERDPERFHGIGAYDAATGESLKSAPKPPADAGSGSDAAGVSGGEAAAGAGEVAGVGEAATVARAGEAAGAGEAGGYVPTSFTDAFGHALVAEARRDRDIFAITAAMAGGTGLKEFEREFPERFIDVGIAEEQAVGMASGLAIAGKKPVVAIYSTFMQRAVDQMIIDCALPNLNVVFALDRAGLVGADGPTHHGAFDLVYTRMVPNLRTFVPSDEAELVRGLHTALGLSGPFAVRYPRGAGEGTALPEAPEVLEVGRSRCLREGDAATILAFGPLAYTAVRAADAFAASCGRQVRVVDMRWAKPIDEEAVHAAAETGFVVTLEEGVIRGGAGEGIAAIIAEQGLKCQVRVLGLGDEFVTQGDTPSLMAAVGLDEASILEVLSALLQ